MSINLCVFPSEIKDVFTNMATDLMLLQTQEYKNHFRFRHYGWSHNAFTFGYFQKYECINAALSDSGQICRRPTGGGIVDHSNDWTYSFIIPPSHSFYRSNSYFVYQFIHKSLLNAIAPFNSNTTLCIKTSSNPQQLACFTQPSCLDLIDKTTGKKIAGAALKRNRQGLLIQGSLSKKKFDLATDWDIIKERLIKQLADKLNAKIQTEDNTENSMLKNYIEILKAPTWNKKR